MGDDRTALWLAIVAIGVYHGLNPAMGWPLAVASGLEHKRDRAVFATLAPLGAGHFGAMAVVLVPFALLAWIVEWQHPIRVGTGLVVLLFGVYKLFSRRHPRFLARVRPTQLAWWSFLMATAHGAGLMLLPFALGLCSPADQPAAASLLRSGGATVLLVAIVHTLAMVLSGVAVAWLVYRRLGLRFLNRGWLDLDAAWGACLVLAGAASLATALAAQAQ
jgi:hypothetical protein